MANRQPLPTDREILDQVYNCYLQEHDAHTREKPLRLRQNLVPINTAEIAKQLGVSPNIIFGRLHYHMNEKYGYRKSDGVTVPMFLFDHEEGGIREMHLINWPLMSSVLAGLRSEHDRFRLATGISILSLAISIAALFLMLGGGSAN